MAKDEEEDEEAQSDRSGEDADTSVPTSSPEKSEKSEKSALQSRSSSRASTLRFADSPSKSEPSSPVAEMVSRTYADMIERMGSDDRKKARASNTMRSSGRQPVLRNGGTLLEKGLGTFGDVLFSARSTTLSTMKTDRTLTSSDDPDVLRKVVKERRGEGYKPPTIYESFDMGAERVISRNIEQPWCLQSCMDSPTCQRFCHPAEYATRSRRDQIEFGAGGGAGDKDAAEKMYGLPEWEKAGYCLMTYEESHWIDERVPMRLGLQLAVHRKTSVERLCLQKHKSKIPAGVTKDQLVSLTRNLKRCDHVNVLRCHEVCEDESCLYLLYDNFPCVTLLSVLEVQQWTQEQLVNIARECCAAVAFATSVGLFHLGWTLCHILLPVTSLTGDPMVAKVFGFGLMGNIQTECSDRMCWAPEACESWVRVGDSFLLRMEANTKSSCDLWSLGAIIFSLVARRPPVLGSPEAMTDMIIMRKWSFTLAFDEMDPEAKSLIESLLEANAEKRIKAESCLRNEWIRRRWQPPPHRYRVFDHLEDFCSAPLAKRLFGRFLVRFLDAEHLRQIAHSFYALDSQGDGVLCFRDLSGCAKAVGRPPHSVKTIMDWMCGENAVPSISLTRFAECMAEDVIDGKALRHAFESLDDDGSECISAEELFDELSAFDEELTMEQVLEHIAEAEADIHENVEKMEEADPTSPKGEKAKENEEEDKEKKLQEKDHKIDFEEFIHLFPVRLKRLKAMQERAAANVDYAEATQKQLANVTDDALDWLRTLERERKNLDKLSNEVNEKDRAEQATKEMKKAISRIAEYLRSPPGPASAKAMAEMMQGKAHPKKKSKNSKANKSTEEDLYGFESFIQDQAIKDYWAGIVIDEAKLLRAAIIKDPRTGMVEQIDHFKAHDAAETAMSKLSEIIDWTRYQMEEYSSIVQVLNDTEPGIPALVLSSRGIQHRGEEEDDDGEEDDRDTDDKHGSMFSRFIAKFKGG